MDFASQVEGQVDQKIDHMASCWQVGRDNKKTLNLQRVLHFEKFFHPSALQLRSQIHKKKRSQADQKSSKQLVIPTKTPNNIQIPTYTTKNNQKLAQTLESIQQNNSLPIIKKPKTNSFDAISRDLVGELSPKQTKLQPVIETKPPKLTQASLENNLNFDLLKIDIQNFPNL